MSWAICVFLLFETAMPWQRLVEHRVSLSQFAHVDVFVLVIQHVLPGPS